MLARDLRTSRERTLFTISAIFSTIVWLALLISIIGILYGLLFGAVALVVSDADVANGGCAAIWLAIWAYDDPL